MAIRAFFINEKSKYKGVFYQNYSSDFKKLNAQKNNIYDKFIFVSEIKSKWIMLNE
jgi:hypothetical protein